MSVTTSKNVVLVCYHYPCADGVFSALAAWLHFAGSPEDADVRFLGLRTYDSADARIAAVAALPAAGRAYLLDFSGGARFVRAIFMAVLA